MIVAENEYITHSGTPHEGMIPHSGRYEYGSGKNPSEDLNSITSRVKKLKEGGITKEKDIAEALGMSMRELRASISNESNAARAYDINRVQKMRQHGYSVTNISSTTGLSETTVRKYLSNETNDYKNTMEVVKDELRSACSKYKYVDIGLGAEGGIAGGISKDRLEKAAKVLVNEEGYAINKVKIPNLSAGVGKNTTMTVLSKNEDNLPSNVISSDIYKNIDAIGIIGVKSNPQTGEINYIPNIKPVSIDSKRIEIAYESPKDGCMEIRPGVEDLSLGSNRYAQVRIAVDDSHYLKGVAIYNDDLPKGVDVRFHTNKKEGTPMMSDDPDGKQVLKSLKDDPSNPFGATTYVQTYVGKDGKTHQSAVNIVNAEGTWDEWSKSLPSQFLSKQSKELIKQQLDTDLQFRQEALEEIRSLTNPEIKKSMLEDFAGSCDTAAEHLRGAAMPRQKTQLLIPVPELKDNEVYAPNFENGERVCLVRYPHAGTFEIPELIVNNNNPIAKKQMKGYQDAVGVNARVAEQLSGADFDGDTVVVLPNNKGQIKTTAPIKELIDFDAKKSYGLKDRRLSGDPTCPERMTPAQKGREMGLVSNLITDMTFLGAPQAEIVRAVKHVYVVIDAEKHDLDFRQSYIDNGIAQLQEKYQGRKGGGSGTIVSRSTGPTQILERRGYTKINKDTGELEYTPTGKTHYVMSAAGKKQQKAKELHESGKSYEDIAKELKVTTKTAEKYINTELDKGWKEVDNLQEVSKMSQVKDARTLMSGYNIKTKNGEFLTERNTSVPEGRPKEYLYAEYANKCKAMANEARKESLSVAPTKYNKEAREKYSEDVAKITAQINEIEKNKPIERRAQAIANVRYKTVMDMHPEYKQDKDKIKKEKNKAVAYGRAIAGSKASQLKITEEQYKAILSGAFTSNQINKIIDYSDSDHFKSLALPKQTVQLSDAKINRIKSMARNGATYGAIANAMGCSATTISKYLNE